MPKLAYLKPQETFPREDLTTENADLLELLFLNRIAFDEMHTAAEGFSYLYKIGHIAIVKASKQHIIKHESEALSAGVSTYEGIAKIVAPIEHTLLNTMLIRPHIESAYRAISENYKEETEHLAELFTNHLPNTSRIVQATAERFNGGAVEHAIIGAALAYRLEMGASKKLGFTGDDA